MIEQIREYVDVFLSKRATELEMDKTKFNIYMNITPDGKLRNLLYHDPIGPPSMISIAQVVPASSLPYLFRAFHSSIVKKIETAIIEGFNRFAVEKNADACQLRLRLGYVNGELKYQGYKDNLAIDANLEEFFKQEEKV